MTSLRQKALRFFYPLLMKGSKWAGNRAAVIENKEGKLFQTPIYDLTVTLNNGTVVPLRNWKGRKLLFVNTASDCGYTEQYR
jgi:glutathione peroxidase